MSMSEYFQPHFKPDFNLDLLRSNNYILGDLIERQFLGGAYNPQLGAAISLVMMIIVLVCMLVMNRFGEGEEQAVML